jgi:hypothetical protein
MFLAGLTLKPLRFIIIRIHPLQLMPFIALKPMTANNFLIKRFAAMQAIALRATIAQISFFHIFLSTDLAFQFISRFFSFLIQIFNLHLFSFPTPESRMRYHFFNFFPRAVHAHIKIMIRTVKTIMRIDFCGADITSKSSINRQKSSNISEIF